MITLLKTEHKKEILDLVLHHVELPLWTNVDFLFEYHIYKSWGYFEKEKLLSVCIFLDSGEESELLYCITRKEFRKKGLSTQTLTFSLNKLHKPIFLEVSSQNTTAIQLYKNLGFIKIAERKNYYITQNGTEDAIIMKRMVDITGIEPVPPTMST